MNNKVSAKILCHAEGVGPPTSDMVRQRAEEIARIDGRQEHNQEDWKQAFFELHGHPHSSDNQENEMVFSGQDMVAYDSGHHTENVGSEGTDNIAEELIIEGMEEAIHDQMLEASRGSVEALEEEEGKSAPS